MLNREERDQDRDREVDCFLMRSYDARGKIVTPIGFTGERGEERLTNLVATLSEFHIWGFDFSVFSVFLIFDFFFLFSVSDYFFFPFVFRV